MEEEEGNTQSRPPVCNPALEKERLQQGLVVHRPFQTEQPPCAARMAGAVLPSLNHIRKVTPEVETMVDDMFTYHPWNEENIARGSVVRVALSDAVKAIINNVPPGPDRSTAIRKIREARMDCNSAITHNGRY
jgi:hypothetical protein